MANTPEENSLVINRCRTAYDVETLRFVLPYVDQPQVCPDGLRNDRRARPPSRSSRSEQGRVRQGPGQGDRDQQKPGGRRAGQSLQARRNLGRAVPVTDACNRRPIRIPPGNLDVLDTLPRHAPADAPFAVRTSCLKKSYGKGEAAVHALCGVTIEIASGQRVALLGKSGSGKSTLLNLLGGLDHPTEGDLEVAGQKLEKLSRLELAAFRLASVGMIFQSFNLIPSRTALDNVELPMIFAGRPRRQPATRRSMRYRPSDSGRVSITGLLN